MMFLKQNPLNLNFFLDYTQVSFWIFILAGLGVFLFGLNNVSKSLRQMAGGKIKKLIDKTSKNKFLALLMGTSITALVQSSGATSALTIGLVRAGILGFVEACVILIGANIGTTLTAFITSIPLMEYFPILCFIGSVILMFVSKKKHENIGLLCFAFGCVFLGLWIIEMNVKTLANEQWFINIFTSLDKLPFVGLIVGAVITALLQSSFAVVSVVQGLFSISGGAITLFGILPIIFGANIGTTVIAVISSIGGSKESKRVALFHVLYNVAGALMFMGIIYIFKFWLNDINNFGTFNGDGEFVFKISPKLLIALSHLIFNVTTAIVFMILLKPICKLIELIIPIKEQKREIPVIKELDKGIFKEFPHQGLEIAKEQVVTMFRYSEIMFETLGTYLETKNKEDAEFIKSIEVSIDAIDRQLNEYLISPEQTSLSSSDVVLLTQILKACKDVERIGDYGDNLIGFYETASEKKEKISEKNMEIFKARNAESLKLITKTKNLFENNDQALGFEVIKERRILNSNLQNIINEHFEEVYNDKEAQNSYVNMVFVDILNAYERVNSHCSNIAKIFGTDKTYNYTTEEEHFADLKNRY